MVLKPRKVALRCVAGALLAIAAPAFAQSEDIDVPATATYRHDGSGIEFPPAFAGFERRRVARFGTTNDIAGIYDQDETGTFATVYVTRVGIPDPGLWFHRVAGLIVRRDGFRPSQDGAVGPEMFVAPGFDRPSGMRLAYDIDGGDLSGSALAIMVYGDRIVKIRVSSEQLDASQLVAAMESLVDALDFPEPWGHEVEPYTVAACSTPLEFDSDAALAERDMQDALVGTMGSILGSDIDDKADNPDRYCLDPASNEQIGAIYQRTNRGGYIISSDDTGRAIEVGGLGLTVSRELGNERWPIQYHLPDETLVLTSFNGLPSPETVMVNLKRENVVGSTDRAGSINVSSDAVGED